MIPAAASIAAMMTSSAPMTVTAGLNMLWQRMVSIMQSEMTCPGIIINAAVAVYIGKTRNGEIDFIATNDKEKLYFQIAYLLDQPKTLDREFGAYKDVKDDCSKYVLSLDKTDFSRDGIIHKNIIDWLLEK